MVSATHVSFNAADRSYTNIAKREIHRIAVGANFKKAKIDKLDIIVAEITSNLVKHAREGELLVGIVDENGEPAIELLAVDKGPGIRDTKKMMEDGASTTSTLGQGLGSIKRLSDFFEIYSQVDWGTVLLSRVYKNDLPFKTKEEKIKVKALSVPMTGETYCGDGWYKKITNDHIKILLGDGLGHGLQANIAVDEAVNAFKLCPYDSPVEILRFIHDIIRKTRGMVATVMVYDIKLKEWKICGIGNIALRLSNAINSKRHSSYNGIVGHNIPNTMNDQTLSEDQVRNFVLCSDGIMSKWDSAKYPMIQKFDLAIQAAAIYKDFGRKTDDMSIIIGKLR